MCFFGEEGNDDSFGRVSMIHEKELFEKLRWMELTHLEVCALFIIDTQQGWRQHMSERERVRGRHAG